MAWTVCNKLAQRETATIKEFGTMNIANKKYLKIVIFVLLFFSFSFSAEYRNGIAGQGNNPDTVKNNSNNTKQIQRFSLCDCTIGMDSICEVHHRRMYKDTVPAVSHWIRYVDIIINLDYNPMPHGENLICAGKGITHAVIYLCPKCVKIKNEFFIKKNHEAVYPKGQKRL
jgi:hypothetical protein